MGPLIANHPAGKWLHTPTSLCRARRGTWFSSEDALSHGEAAHPLDSTACILLLSFTVTSALGKVPSRCWDATCQLPACAFPVLPLLSLPLSPFTGSATQQPGPTPGTASPVDPFLAKERAHACHLFLGPQSLRQGGGSSGRLGGGSHRRGALRAPEVATVEMMQCRAMHSPHYQQMKGETLANIIFTGFTHCREAITHASIISFTLFFAGDEANLHRQPPLPFLKVAVTNHPWVCLHSLARCMAT